MHPNQAFAWTDREAMLRLAADRALAHVFSASTAGLFVAHVPLLITASGRVQFHVARRNRIADHVAGRRILISLTGREAYHSANWYVSENQVPTWHYEAVEIEGEARTLSTAELTALLDGLSEVMEGRYSPAQPWTRGKMAPGKFEAMLKAIVGFEVDPVEIRGTRKFNQHKSAQDLAATVAGQESAGRPDIVAAIDDAAARK